MSEVKYNKTFVLYLICSICYWDQYIPKKLSTKLATSDLWMHNEHRKFVLELFVYPIRYITATSIADGEYFLSM